MRVARYSQHLLPPMQPWSVTCLGFKYTARGTEVVGMGSGSGASEAAGGVKRAASAALLKPVLTKSVYLMTTSSIPVLAQFLVHCPARRHASLYTVQLVHWLGGRSTRAVTQINVRRHAELTHLGVSHADLGVTRDFRDAVNLPTPRRPRALVDKVLAPLQQVSTKPATNSM